MKIAIEKFKDSPIYIPFLLAVTTGMRIGEIAALTWGDIDFKNKTIFIKRTVQRLNK